MLNNARNQTNIFSFNSSLNTSRSNITEKILQAVETLQRKSRWMVFKVFQVRSAIDRSTDYFWLRCKWHKWMLNNARNKIDSIILYVTTPRSRSLLSSLQPDYRNRISHRSTSASTTSAWGQRGIRASETNNYKMTSIIERSDFCLGQNDRIPAVEYSPEKHYYDYCKLICRFLDKYLILSNKYLV